jgi:hypothetical protein
MANESQIDRAATAGYESMKTGAAMPAWVGKDLILVAAWHCGRRQAADKAAAHS